MMRKIKTPSYCFKTNYELQKMDHAYTCMSPFDLSSWENIEHANFFDIKLTSYDFDNYIPVMSKIKKISLTKFCFIHFSNELSHSLTTETKGLFWKLLNILDSGQTFGLEFQHKILKSSQEFNRDFFDTIISKYKHIDWLKLTILVEENDIIYFQRNEDFILDKSNESCILE